MAKFSIIIHNGNLIKLDETTGGTWVLAGTEWYPLSHVKKEAKVGETNSK